MKENLTEIVFILDRSGSMAALSEDTIGGYNAFIKKQQENDGEANITTILFDDKYEILHNRENIKTVNPITKNEYYARGYTAMLDAIGKTINNIGDKLRRTSEDERPSKVIFVITTDGKENVSKEFNKNQIKDMITEQTEKYNWEFIFLGANIDAVTEATSIGIRVDNSCNYTANSVGLNSMYSALSKTVSNYRNTGEIDKSWSDIIK